MCVHHSDFLNDLENEMCGKKVERKKSSKKMKNSNKVRNEEKGIENEE